MRVIAEEECRAWAAMTLGAPFSWDAIERMYPNSCAFVLPADTGRKTALARSLAGMNDAAACLLWITATGVFPSCENMMLFDGYRRSLGEERLLHEAPGHVFGTHDVGELECVLGLTLYFFWDASLLHRGRGYVRLSHDEVLTMNAKDDAVLQSWREQLLPFDLTELTPRSPGPEE